MKKNKLSKFMNRMYSFLSPSYYETTHEELRKGSAFSNTFEFPRMPKFPKSEFPSKNDKNFDFTTEEKENKYCKTITEIAISKDKSQKFSKTTTVSK